MSEGLATTLATEREQFIKYDGSRALFFRDDQPLHAGDTLQNPDLASTLEQIAAGGADAFYQAATSRGAWWPTCMRKGNAIKLSDMARYFAAEREPIAGSYRGYTFFSSAPPVSGGAELAAKLNLLEQYPNPKPYSDDAGTLHAMIAAWQLVPSTRGRIADPEPLAGEHRAVHQPRHGAHALEMLRPEQGDRSVGAAGRHADLRAVGQQVRQRRARA